MLLFLSLAFADTTHRPSVPLPSPVRPWPIRITWRSCVESIWTSGAAKLVPFLHSEPDPTAVAVPDAEISVGAVVVCVELSPIVMSSASSPSFSASAISSSLLPLSPPSCAVTLRPSAVRFAPEVSPEVFLVRSAAYHLLLCPASLVACAFFAHLLLNGMWFPLQ